MKEEKGKMQNERRKKKDEKGKMQNERRKMKRRGIQE
jgi:hypothetical protein